MLEKQIKRVSKYLKSKYPDRYTLTLGQAAQELVMDKSKVKEMKERGFLGSLAIKAIATFIVNNPAKSRQ